MNPSPHRIQIIYLVLLLLSTLATSMIWGIDTLFQLSAGLNNAQVFIVNAFFTVGQVIFEVPTGLVADIKGRRASYLLGTVVLGISTLFYLAAGLNHATLPVWIIGSTLLGLGFTFFSGATEAWLVDALEFTGYKGSLDAVFSRGQMVRGAAMLVGSVAGGFIAQWSALAVPYAFRAAILFITFGVAFVFMHDLGFERLRSVSVLQDAKKLFKDSALFGWQHRAVGWMMLANPFLVGVGFYIFYAMQPFLLEMYGDPTAYGVAGLAAAIVAGSQIIGGFLVPYVRRFFTRRTTIIGVSVFATCVLLVAMSMVNSFAVLIVLLCGWGLISALATPVRQAYLNSLIPTKQRATVLSFDSLVGSSGGVFIQPTLGRVADISSYAHSFVGGAAFQILSLPFVILARKQRVEADEIK